MDALDEGRKERGSMDDDPGSLFFLHSHKHKNHSTTTSLTHGPFFLCSSIPFVSRITKLGIFYQYHRILKRRAARANLEAENRLLQRGRKVRKNAKKKKEEKRPQRQDVPAARFSFLHPSFFSITSRVK